MDNLIKSGFLNLILTGLILFNACKPDEKSNKTPENGTGSEKVEVLIQAETYVNFSDSVNINVNNAEQSFVNSDKAGWLEFQVDIPVAGRYQTEIRVNTPSYKGVNVWIEDYVDNKDGRTYNITGNISITEATTSFISGYKDGSPLNKGIHKIKVHFDQAIQIDWIKFNLIKEHEITPITLTQNTKGDKWKVVWSDEFEEAEIDRSKWTFDVGNWGWGNHELQYYTEGRKENARIEDGNLIIEARKNDMNEKWTSARLTTRGKVSFLYGKIEFRAKVPPNKGNWAAGWTLGDNYIDELSWPYCGEIDILESVGYEMDDKTGNGIAHASVHCGAYYFKLGNQPTSVIDVKDMYNEYHTYAIEWTPEGIKAFVDDNHYFTYEDTSSELAWPFSKPQNIILNLAMGGGWGGAQGMDESITSQKLIIDYVRVYERQ